MSPHMLFITVLASLAFILLCLNSLNQRRLPNRQAALNARTSLGAETIYNLYYSKSGLPKEKVMALWSQIAKELKLDAGKLRPGDRFDKELAPVKGYTVEDELWDFILKEYRDRSETVRKLKPQVLNELIHALLQ